MRRSIKSVGGLSRKAKINILAAMFLLFMIIMSFSSINLIKELIEKREKIVELKEKLDWNRNKNIELLALEKSLYNDSAIEMEAREQFNMVKDDETNISVLIEDAESSGANSDKQQGGQQQAYSKSDLWGNIKIFYQNEIKE